MKILLVGSGGREHALAWKLSQSPHCEQLICAPGNAGICEIADCVNIATDDIVGLVDFALSEAVSFVVVGPEIPLALGLVDELLAKGIAVFGPSERAAMLESSKAFTKDFCTRHNIPTAKYDVFTNMEDAVAYLDEMSAPYVIKADGLAAGKGVVIAQTKADAEVELGEFFSGKFGDASACVVIEEFMAGHEISFFALADGKTVLPLCEAQDHKRAYDGDLGPNTGGMGAYSPVPGFDGPGFDDKRRIMDEILVPTVRGMAAEGYPFTGVLFAGLMMTADGPKLIEYNVRFGDPECQVLVRRMDTDLLELMILASKGKLADAPAVKWHSDSVVNVVMAAQGYPGPYTKGETIKGTDAADMQDGVQVFHAGTVRGDDGVLRSAGGRVLNITASGNTIEQAVARAYTALDDAIIWPGGFVRRDIAKQALHNNKDQKQ
ncbi:MAG: phosphoribosylamine--glycine ligase [Robiginitomaculum sp.]|nr:MAG: phosphoribosylamine--glycine ligase [Robiginitomaculum sp.]